MDHYFYFIRSLWFAPIHVVVLLLLRDLMLNLVPVVLAADGASQVVVLSYVFGFWGVYIVLREPHLDRPSWFN